MHAHEEWVVAAMVTGAEVLTTRRGSLVVAAGDLILLPPGEAHSNHGAGTAAFGYSVMYIPERLIDQVLADPRRGTRSFKVDGPVARHRSLHRKVLRTYTRLINSSDPLDQQSQFLLLLSDLVGSGDAERTRNMAAAPRKIELARAYIESHFRDSLPLGKLAEMASLSPYHLLRSFRSQVGLPPASYQTQLRIAEAKRLLREGCSIAEAAAEVGFADQSHLTRHFQRLVGTTPGRYAQQ